LGNSKNFVSRSLMDDLLNFRRESAADINPARLTLIELIRYFISSLSQKERNPIGT